MDRSQEVATRMFREYRKPMRRNKACPRISESNKSRIFPCSL